MARLNNYAGRLIGLMIFVGSVQGTDIDDNFGGIFSRVGDDTASDLAKIKSVLEHGAGVASINPNDGPLQDSAQKTESTDSFSALSSGPLAEHTADSSQGGSQAQP